MTPDHDPTRSELVNRSGGHGLLREGIVTGLLGAAAVALWFLIVDLVQGRPFHTPAVLGALVSRAGEPDRADYVSLTALYTVVHVVAFALVGTLAVFLIHRAQRTPALLGLLLMLFAATEVGIIALVAALDVQALGSLAWYQVAIGNLLAAVTMGTYLVRRHQGLGASFGRALAGHG